MFKTLSSPILDFPVSKTLIVKEGFCCFGQTLHRIQIYGVVHGLENDTLSPQYRTEIMRQLGYLIGPNTFVFYEGGLDTYAPMSKQEMKQQIWSGRDMQLTQTVSSKHTLPLLSFFSYKTAQDVQQNVENGRAACDALGKLSHKSHLKRTLDGNAFLHTVDSLLMACRIAAKLFELDDGTESVVICGALHSKQLSEYLKEFPRLYQHFCEAMRRLDVKFTPLKSTRTIGLKEMAEFVRMNSKIFYL